MPKFEWKHCEKCGRLRFGIIPVEGRGNATALFFQNVLQLAKNFMFHVYLTIWLFLPGLAFF